jgi:hypothetical protein
MDGAMHSLSKVSWPHAQNKESICFGGSMRSGPAMGASTAVTMTWGGGVPGG